MAHYKGEQVGGGGVGRWAARDGLNPPLVLFGLAVSPRGASNGPKHA